ncbi:MAG TPA: TraR/DksA family transcriptional regulator [Candidatus Acidoferrales bacterium]|nr:TraR/DksA family transcriptional regulator [Candidatus Acidoferrales bacterium]
MSVEPKHHERDGHELIRELLTRLQDETGQRIKDLRRDQEQESETEPEDEMDLASTSAEVETHAGLIARAEEKLRYLDEALARLDAGKYGNCLGCGGAIAIERLMAIPFASYCVDCQEERSRARPGWGEGTTIAPYDHQWTVPEEMEPATDRESHSTDPEERLTIDSRESIGSLEPNGQAAGTAAPKKRTARRRR